MRFLHLSDLHIGKRVNEFSMIEDQIVVLRQVLQVIDEEQVDAVLIAGDVYDKSVPSAEAVQVFDQFLTGLASKKIPVFIISGNHDSAERLSFASQIMKESQIYVSPVYKGAEEPIILKDAYGEIAVYLLPFVKPAHVRAIYGEEKIESYTDAIRVAIRHMDIKEDRRNILVAHQFVSGSTRCESEEVSIGGLDQVDVEVFEPFDYVALGHLHGPQKVGREEVRYAGTLLKYSFSEVAHKKAIYLVDILEKGCVTQHTKEIVAKRNMRKLKGSYMELTDRSNYMGSSTDDYLEITLTDEEEIMDAMGKLRTIYPNIMHILYDNQRTRGSQEVLGAEKVKEKSPFQLLEEFYELQNNQKMSEKQQELVQEIMEEIWEGR